jgi:hypothetical protein
VLLLVHMLLPHRASVRLRVLLLGQSSTLVLSCMQADPQARPHSVLSVQKVLSQAPQAREPSDGASAYQATQFFPVALRSAEKFLR